MVPYRFLRMLLLILEDSDARDAARQAAVLCGVPCRDVAGPAALLDSPDALGTASLAGHLLVHDFAPDPSASIACLDALAAEDEVAVFALLHPPASAALGALVRAPRRWACLDAALITELSVRALAGRLGAALARAQERGTCRTFADTWHLDPVLTALARETLTLVTPTAAMAGVPEGGQATWPTLQRVLASAGVARRTFLRHARDAGFRPPLRFLHTLRVLVVVEAMRRGETAGAAAKRFGYGSPETMRRHFDTVAGLTPREARRLSAPELLRRMHPTDAELDEN